MKAVVDRQSHQDRQLHKQWYSGATSELWTERVEFSEEESVHHQVDTHTESESETDSSEEQPDVEENIDREILEQLEILKLPKPTADQQINTFVVDLKVSQELLRQANQSLDTVEDHLDFRDAPSSIHTVSSSAPSMFPLSTNHPGEGTAAAGRHSNQYSLLTQRGKDWSKNLEAQLQDRNWELMSEVELDLWLRHYPAEQQHFEQDRLLQLSSDCDMAEFYSVKTHHSEMELSQMQQRLHRCVTLINCLSLMTNGAAATFMEINESIHAFTLITSYRKLPFALQLNPTDENDSQEQQYPICASHIGTN
ncbi:hypothetical protein JOB18_041869 [Solea senegalensis]|uniref:Uncharacterized protein n=1 Tax=Solea senegalensis TaxID=28829 RepID=A0AAV6SFU3_SOLSE|nr:hypothetical protein JOB18_041869 [Solea senegalensis]